MVIAHFCRAAPPRGLSVLRQPNRIKHPTKVYLLARPRSARCTGAALQLNLAARRLLHRTTCAGMSEGPELGGCVGRERRSSR